MIAFQIQHFDTLDSTNSEALRQAKNGAREGLVVVARAQTAGKGRLGRSWQTVEHALAFTLLLRPNLPANTLPSLSLMAAVSIHQALLPWVDSGIKWPNDILIQGKKVCGILTETQQHHDRISVALGIGINIHEPQAGWAKNMRTPPTSLQAHTRQAVDRDTVLASVLQSIDAWYHQWLTQGFAPIAKAWEVAHIAQGKAVCVHDGSAYIQGIALGLADDGALRLLVNGEEQRIIAGDVSMMERV